jgi:hypothetical protein
MHTTWHYTRETPTYIWRKNPYINVHSLNMGCRWEEANSKHNSGRLPQPRQNLITWIVKSACDDKIHQEWSLKFGAGLPENVTRRSKNLHSKTNHFRPQQCHSLHPPPPVLGQHHPKQSKAVCCSQFLSCIFLDSHSAAAQLLSPAVWLYFINCKMPSVPFIIFHFSKNALTGSDVHSACHFTTTKGSFLGVKWPEHEADHSPPSSAIQYLCSHCTPSWQAQVQVFKHGTAKLGTLHILVPSPTTKARLCRSTRPGINEIVWS